MSFRFVAEGGLSLVSLGFFLFGELNKSKALPRFAWLRSFLFLSLPKASFCRVINKKALPFHGKAFSL
jgi:hypothetical protein